MQPRLLTTPLLAATLLFAACHTAPVRTPAARDHGYSLLYSTIDDECDVAKVLIIKRTSPQLATLLKDIAAFSQDTRKSLSTLATNPPPVTLKDQGLPEAESKTRDAISAATTREVLGSKDSELELRLLLTQHEALNYVRHLAAVLTRDEPDERRKDMLDRTAKHAAALDTRVLEQLRKP